MGRDVLKILMGKPVVFNFIRIGDRLTQCGRFFIDMNGYRIRILAVQAKLHPVINLVRSRYVCLACWNHQPFIICPVGRQRSAALDYVPCQGAIPPCLYLHQSVVRNVASGQVRKGQTHREALVIGMDLITRVIICRPQQHR
ncbi:hypothetical protein D3C87_1336340 [compost metagenome]